MEARVGQKLCIFFNDTATTEIYTLSLHDALPILRRRGLRPLADRMGQARLRGRRRSRGRTALRGQRSEEHTSELQSRQYLVCRLLLEKKKTHHNPSLLTIIPGQPLLV